jgi:predicted amidohydrolase
MALEYEMKLDSNPQFFEQLDLKNDSTILAQIKTITDELEVASNLESMIRRQTNKVDEIEGWARASTEQRLNKDIVDVTKELEDIKLANETEIVKIKKRHADSIMSTKLRAERIINAAERYLFIITKQCCC